MKYSKPQITGTTSASIAIMDQQKQVGTPLDGSTPNIYTTNAAYSADE